MTQTTKEILEKYQIRKSKKQKTAFIQYAEQVAKSYGYDVNVEKGDFGARNIVIGNPDTAKVLYTAHYDTPARSLLPNFITPKNFFFYVLFQLVIVGLALVVALLIRLCCELIFPLLPIPEKIALSITSILSQLGFMGYLLSLIFGPANKNTVNDNTSGITTVLDIMKELPQDQRSKVAFVLFDLEEKGLLGSSSFASKHKATKKNTLVINFDCVSDGDIMLFTLKKDTQQYAELLEKTFVSNEDVVVEVEKVIFYPSDNASFKNGIGVVSLNKTKKSGILYADKIHTKRDVVYREENIRFLTDGSIKLAQQL